jgi:hypothetical protein
MDFHSATPIFGKPVSRVFRAVRMIFVGLLLAMLVFMPMQLASATAPDPNNPVKPVQQDPYQGNVISAVGTTCATHNWLAPTGGAVTINLLEADNTPHQGYVLYSQLTFDNGTMNAYCTDFFHGVDSGDRYCLDTVPFADWRVSWVIANYPPTPDSRTDLAARQAAVWTLTNNITLNLANTTTEGTAVDDAVRIAYQAIMGSIPPTEPAAYAGDNLSLTITPSPSSSFVPGQETVSMVAHLANASIPFAGVPLTLTTSDSLNSTTISVPNNITDVNGNVPFTITNTSGQSYTATINAHASVTLKLGFPAVNMVDAAGRQQLGIAQDTLLTVNGQGTHTWQPPTTLISIHKFEDLNFNQVQDTGEPNLAGWNFQLTLPDLTTLTATTNSSGNAYFYNVNQFGTYKITEVLTAGWVNSTPLEVTRNRTAADPWTSWAVTYGNARTNIIRILKYHDLNQNKIQDPGEPVLPGWQFTLEQSVGSTWSTVGTGTTGPDGYLSFTNLAAGTYRITETPQTGWSNTTPLVQTITIPANGSTSFIFPVSFGNIQLGSLRVDKAVNWNGATSTPVSFEFCITGPAPATTRQCKTVNITTGTTGSQTFTDLLPGAYLVEETAPDPLRWTVSGSGVSVVVASNATASTTITNTYLYGKLAIHKAVVWSGVTPVSSQFTICITGPSYASITVPGACQTITVTTGGDATWDNLLAGDYTISETGVGPEWAVTYSSATVSVANNGGTANATVTNTRKLGSLTVTKIIDWNGADPLAVSFNICVAGPSLPKTTTNPNGDCVAFAYPGPDPLHVNQIPHTWENLIPGSYEITETDPGNDWDIPLVVTSPTVVPTDGSTAVATVTNTHKPPTAVTLVYFKSGGVKGYKITLLWQTAAEVDNFGFNIYRSNQKDFNTATLIATVPTQSKGSAGASYSYVDQMPGSGHWYYWLVDIDTSGAIHSRDITNQQPVDGGPQDKYIYIPGVIR